MKDTSVLAHATESTVTGIVNAWLSRATMVLVFDRLELKSVLKEAVADMLAEMANESK